MIDLSTAIEYRSSRVAFSPAALPQVAANDPRRVAIYFSVTDANAVVWVWPSITDLKLGAGLGFTAVPLILRRYSDGALVCGEWFAGGQTVCTINVLELLAVPGTADQAVGKQPGKCYKFAGGRWQELVNGAFPGSGDGAK